MRLSLPSVWRPFKCSSSSSVYHSLGRQRFSSTALKRKDRYGRLDNTSHIEVLGVKYATDEWTNVTPRIIDHLSRRLHKQPLHPINRLSGRVVNSINEQFKNKRGNPLFSVHDYLSPVVSLEQNFDSLLVPTHHPSRSKSDSYYINRDWMLRAHTSAHQAELIRSGLDNFVVVGDVYRRDEIDASHYPAFHQLEGVRLFTKHQLNDMTKDSTEVQIFENGSRSEWSQERHSDLAAELVSNELKSALLKITKALFGQDVEYRWTDCFFPFTHPSWELEIFHSGKWLEVLGCGVIEHALLERAGVHDRIGWAFGIGLDRLAMKLFQIPDIRLLWSNDTGFISQFKHEDIDEPIVYKALSKYPQSIKDLSFWLPSNSSFSSNDFYDVVRDEGGDMIEQVELIDDFEHPSSGRKSHCYRIVYRSMNRTLTKQEVAEIHERIAKRAALQLKVEVRAK